MSVLILAQYFPPDLGGAATRAYNMAKGLALNGCKVTVIAAVPHYPHGNIPKKYRWTPIKIEQMDNFKVIRTIMPPIKSDGFLRRLALIGAFTVSSLFAFLADEMVRADRTEHARKGEIDTIFGACSRLGVGFDVDTSGFN